MKTLDQLLGELRQCDVKLWVEDDRLRYRSAKNALTPELLIELKTRKLEIIEFLERATTVTSAKLPPIERVDRQGQLFLSFAQQRFWFLHQFEPASSANNMPVVVRFEGALDVAVLERTLQALVDRHEVLRTYFPAVDGQPTQVIAPNFALKLPIVDLRHLPASQREDRSLELATEAARHPFDLVQEPSLRVLLLRLRDDEYLLVWSMHCIICDGAAADLFYQELTALYIATIAGKSSPLPALPLQYVDFAQWQRQWVQGDVLAAQSDYWQRQLAGIPPTIQLPIDRSRPPHVQTYRCDRAARLLPLDLLTDLTSLSQKLGGTLFMTLLATFEILLHRYSHQTDLPMSFVSAGRDRVETEALMGFFANTLIHRIDLGGNPTFRELFDRVRTAALDAYAHQDLPFEQLLTVLPPAQSQSRSPLFQVKFTLNQPWSNGQGMAPVELDNLQIASLSDYIYHGKTKYDLTLVICERDAGLEAVFDYNAELFDAGTIERMLDHFHNLAIGILANPDRPIATLPLLSWAERELLQGGEKVPTVHAEPTYICELFAAQVARTPDALAIKSDRTKLTYYQLDTQANQLAHYLQSSGVGVGTAVGIYLEPTIEAIVTLLGTLKAGGICVPIDPLATTAQIAALCMDAGIVVVVTQSPSLTLTGSSVRSIVLDSFKAAIDRQPQTAPILPARSAQLAYILYPHQTTTEPIGVSIFDRSIGQLACLDAQIALTGTDTMLQLSALSSELAIFEIWSSLLNGASLAIPPASSYRYISPERGEIGVNPPKSPLTRGTKIQILAPLLRGIGGFRSKNEVQPTCVDPVATTSRSLVELGRFIHQQGVTSAFLPTRLLHQLATRLEDLQSLRQIFTSGAALSPNVVQQLAQLPCQLINAYMPANTGLTCYQRVGTGAVTQIPIGRAIDSVQTFILDANCQPVPIGIVGQLYIGGDRLAQGYVNQPELGNASRSIDPELNGARLYRTGDLARYLPDGAIELIGAIDTIPIVDGLQVEIAKIETALSQHPDLWEALVMMQPHLAQGQGLVAYVVPRSTASVSITELYDYLQHRISAHMLPSAFVWMTALPLTTTGAVDLAALPLPDAASQPQQTAFVAAQDEIESQLTQIWESLLGVRSIGVTTNFFDLGGNSLTAVRLFAQIATTFDRTLPLSILFQAPTIQQLATIIRQDVAQDVWSPLVELQAGTSPQALFCIHGGGFNVLIYRDLCLHLDPNLTIYGLQARGLDIDRPLVARLEEMATDYITEIQRVQPYGPYLLAGLSNGGQIAIEMAQQLQAQGKTVALVAMFDSYAPDGMRLLSPYPRFGSALWYLLKYSVPRAIAQSGSPQLTTKLQRAIERLIPAKHPTRSTPSTTPTTTHPNHPASPTESAIERYLNRISSYILEHSPWAFFEPSAQLQASNDPVSQRLKQLEQSYRQIYRDYIPQTYRGRIVLFRAMEPPPGYHLDRTLGWGKIATDGVEVHKIPGNHTTIMRSPVLAQKMSKCLQQAMASQL